MNSAVEKATDTTPQYAQVAVPVHLAKTFTYRLPPSMQPVARVGSRVIVPLGTKQITGYIVALVPTFRTGTSLVESEVKDVQQLLDVEPPLTPEVVCPVLTRFTEQRLVGLRQSSLSCAE